MSPPTEMGFRFATQQSKTIAATQQVVTTRKWGIPEEKMTGKRPSSRKNRVTV
jgi:hypothetical protein